LPNWPKIPRDRCNKTAVSIVLFFYQACVERIVTSILLVLQTLPYAPRIYRHQSAVLVLSGAVPMIGNALYISKLSPFPNMSYELRTPLTSILSYSELLQRRAGDQRYTDIIGDLQLCRLMGGEITADSQIARLAFCRTPAVCGCHPRMIAEPKTIRSQVGDPPGVRRQTERDLWRRFCLSKTTR
jgi:hypothetical protein